MSSNAGMMARAGRQIHGGPGARVLPKFLEACDKSGADLDQLLAGPSTRLLTSDPPVIDVSLHQTRAGARIMFSLTREEFETVWSDAAATWFRICRPQSIGPGRGAVSITTTAKIRDAKAAEAGSSS
jgi:hypothetical protein